MSMFWTCLGLFVFGSIASPSAVIISSIATSISGLSNTFFSFVAFGALVSPAAGTPSLLLFVLGFFIYTKTNAILKLIIQHYDN